MSVIVLSVELNSQQVAGFGIIMTTITKTTNDKKNLIIYKNDSY